MPNVGRLRYLEIQPKPNGRAHGTLVLLHAFPLNARMWEPQLALADRGWRVIAPHVRGADGASGDPSASSIDDFAADVVDLLDALHLQDAVIAGLSMGGYVAFAVERLAARYVRGLVLADTRPQADTPQGFEARTKLLKVLQDQGPAAVADDMIPKLLGATTRREQPELADRIRALVVSNSADAIAGMIRALMSRPDSTSQLAGIHTPTLIIVGAEDTLTPPAVSQEMHRAIAGSELVVIPGAGHLSNLEQTAAFNAALARFLDHRV